MSALSSIVRADRAKSLARCRKITQRRLSKIGRKDAEWCSYPNTDPFRSYGGRSKRERIAIREERSQRMRTWISQCAARGEIVRRREFDNLCDVYLLWEPISALHKIGISTDVMSRIVSLTLLDSRVKASSLLTTIECCCRRHAEIVEAALHSALDRWRVVGEWFALTHVEAAIVCHTMREAGQIPRRNGLRESYALISGTHHERQIVDTDWLFCACQYCESLSLGLLPPPSHRPTLTAQTFLRQNSRTASRIAEGEALLAAACRKQRELGA